MNWGTGCSHDFQVSPHRLLSKEKGNIFIFTMAISSEHYLNQELNFSTLIVEQLTYNTWYDTKKHTLSNAEKVLPE